MTFRVAIFIGYPDYSSKASTIQLGQPTHGAMREYTNVASYYMTSQGCLVNSLEGLNILLLEAILRLNEGRASWLIIRHCIAVAQLIGLADNSKPHEQRMWFCIFYADRTLSLELSLLFAVEDETSIDKLSVNVETPSKTLDRIHVLPMRCVIERNLHLHQHAVVHMI